MASTISPSGRVPSPSDSSSRSVPGGSCFAPPSSQSCRSVGACSGGTRLRVHCSQADTATACQCASFFSARSPLSLSTLRSATSGVMLAAPSSAAFSTSQSMRSLAVMPASRCTGRSGSRSTAWCAPMRTATSLRPMRRTVASNSPPLKPSPARP
ncbi:hypothetical protein GY15_14390 [Delftia sp. 670]|nr:hypothetical protein GY15_14390 [Delftia sp. 670]